MVETNTNVFKVETSGSGISVIKYKANGKTASRSELQRTGQTHHLREYDRLDAEYGVTESQKKSKLGISNNLLENLAKGYTQTSSTGTTEEADNLLSTIEGLMTGKVAVETVMPDETRISAFITQCEKAVRLLKIELQKIGMEKEVVRTGVTQSNRNPFAPSVADKLESVSQYEERIKTLRENIEKIETCCKGMKAVMAEVQAESNKVEAVYFKDNVTKLEDINWAKELNLK